MSLKLERKNNTEKSLSQKEIASNVTWARNTCHQERLWFSAVNSTLDNLDKLSNFFLFLFFNLLYTCPFKTLSLLSL